MTTSSADTAEHPVTSSSGAAGDPGAELPAVVVRRPLHAVRPVPPATPATPATHGAEAAEVDGVAEVVELVPPVEGCRRGRVEHLAELRQARRQRWVVAAVGLLAMAGTLVATVLVLDVLH